MSLVTLTTPAGATYSAELQTSREFRLPGTGNAGQATLRVPYSSSLASKVSPSALDLVLIHHGQAGNWRGIVTGVEYGRDGITLSVIQPWGLIGRRIVKRGDTVKNVWPGYLVGVAMDAAQVAGMTNMNGWPVGDTPLIPSYQFGYGDAWSIITAMMDESDGELWVDPATGAVDWCGALACANAYGPLLFAGQSFRDWRYTTDASDQVSEVIGVSGMNAYTTARGDVAAQHWPAQAAVVSRR